MLIKSRGRFLLDLLHMTVRPCLSRSITMAILTEVFLLHVLRGKDLWSEINIEAVGSSEFLDAGEMKPDAVMRWVILNSMHQHCDASSFAFPPIGVYVRECLLPFPISRTPCLLAGCMAEEHGSGLPSR